MSVRRQCPGRRSVLTAWASAWGKRRTGEENIENTDELDL